MTERAPDVTTDEGLVRGIGRWSLVLLVLNSVIGSGIFGLPGEVFALAGSWSLLAYVVCGLVVALIVFCFAEVCSRFTRTGGPYLYALEAFGPAAAFQMGWLLWLARLTAFAALCNLWLDYFDFFVPGVNAGVLRIIAICLIVAVLTLVNIRGVRDSTAFNDFFTLAKLVPLILLVIVGSFFIEPSNFSFQAAPEFNAFSTAVLLLVFAFSGFEVVVIPAGEAQDPGRHTPFALITGIAIIVVLYLAIQFVTIGNVPGLADSSRPLADAAQSFLGTPGAAIISLGALISVTGTLNVVMLSSPRLPFAMAEHGQLPALMAATHPRFHTPHISILLSSAVMLVLTIQGNFISALTISTLIRLVTYGATCVSLPILRRRPGVAKALFNAPGGVVTAVLATVLCIYLILTSGRDQVQTTALVVLFGFVLYFLFRGRGTPQAPATDGDATAI